MIRPSSLRVALLIVAFAAGSPMTEGAADSRAPYVVVLGIAQDGGVPQAGSVRHPAWIDAALRRHVVCLGVVDPAASQRWMIEATPDFRAQLHMLNTLAPAARQPGLNGIFVTHAHMGHYTGLMFLGHESMGARRVPVYAMPGMRRYLATNGPWDQLVRYENIVLRALDDGVAVPLNARLRITPLLVPHRQEYSEVVAFRLEGPERSVLFLPDIDGWEELDAMGTPIESWIAQVDVAFLDASFFDHGEIPGRDMSGFPHPFIRHSMERFAPLPAAERAKIRFIHLNHTNPALIPGSASRNEIEARGFSVAEEGERIQL